jgi:hypothetical protein
MKKLLELGKRGIIRFLNVVVIGILLTLFAAFMVVDGIILTNVVNQLQTGTYLDVTFGVQTIFLFVTLSAYIIYFKEYVSSR